jgi:hypothetical protein
MGRGLNPNDGSRRRLKSEEHRAKKDYKRFSKSELHKLIQSKEIDINEYLQSLDEDN